MPSFSIDQHPLKYCIENLQLFPNNKEYSSVANKSVLVASPVDEDLVQTLQSQNPANLYVIKSTDSALQDTLLAFLAARKKGSVDFVFIDFRKYIQENSKLELILSCISSVLSSSGVIFSCFYTSRYIRYFDVQNMLGMTELGWLPTSQFLLDSLLHKWAARHMYSKSIENLKADLYILRLTPKRKSILLICGHSMAGKTTLSRELINLNPYIHVSNDAVYLQILSAKKSQLSSVESQLLNILGDGSGEDCGNFNRKLEEDVDLLEIYVKHLINCLPSNQELISIDVDLRKKESINYLKAVLDNHGYSVWLVAREI